MQSISSEDRAAINAVVQSLRSGKELPAGVELVPSSASTRVARVNLSFGICYVKVFQYRAVVDVIKQLLRGTRAKRSVRAAERLVAAQLDTPPVVVQGGNCVSNWVVTQGVPAISLGLYIDRFLRGPLTPACLVWKREIITELGRAIGAMHNAGIIHGDLRLNNILLHAHECQPHFYLIDNERNQNFTGIAPMELLIKNLAQLNLLFPQYGVLTDRFRFLRQYFTVFSRLTADERRRLIIGAGKLSEQRMINLAKKPVTLNPLTKDQVTNVPA